MSQRNHGFDLLRCFSMGVIVSYHYTTRYCEVNDLPKPAIFIPASAATVAVSVFLVLLGFFSYSVLNDRDAKYSSYLKKRFMRLIPTYWLAVCVATVVVLLSGQGKVILSQFVLNLALVNRLFDIAAIDGAWWYMTIVVVWTAIVALCLCFRLERRWIPLVCWFIAYLAYCALDQFGFGINHYVAFLLFQYINKCICGLELARFAMCDRESRMAVGAVIAVVLAGELVWSGQQQFVCDAIAVALVTFVSIVQPIVLKGKPANILNWLSRESYFIYLTHQRFGFVVITSSLINGTTYVFAIANAIILLLCLASVHFRLSEWEFKVPNLLDIMKS